MSRLRIVTWNAEGMFTPITDSQYQRTRRADEHDALQVVKDIRPDVMMIPEFGIYGQLDATVRNALHSLGYEIIEVPYEDKEVVYALSMVVLTRLPVVSHEVVRFGKFRNAVQVVVADGDKKIRIVGVHLDDQLEAVRLRQAQDLIELVSTNKKIPTFVLGDFNAMRRKSGMARIMNVRALKKPISRLPHPRLRNISTRLQQMASGTTIEKIEQETHLKNLDPGHHLSTTARQAGFEWLPAVRLAKLDWIFGTRHFKVARYHVYKDVGSDHRPVIVDVEL